MPTNYQDISGRPHVPIQNALILQNLGRLLSCGSLQGFSGLSDDLSFLVVQYDIVDLPDIARSVSINIHSI